MIIANARRVLFDAEKLRSSDECERIGLTVLDRAGEQMGVPFTDVRRIVDNRNSVCLRAEGAGKRYLLKVNRNPDSHEVRGAALRMNAVAGSDIKGAFSVPQSHYIDEQYDAALMEFVEGTRLDILLQCNPDRAAQLDYVRQAVRALATIHHSSEPRPDEALRQPAADLVRDVSAEFPRFARRNAEALNRLASGKNEPAVSIHGDFSPKNLIFDAAGTIHVIDFSHPVDSVSPLRDAAIFAIGMARAMLMANPAIALASDAPVEELVQGFIDEYLAGAGHTAQEQGALRERLVLYELLRLAETRIWTDGYRAFTEGTDGWLKAKFSRVFIALQLRRLQSRIRML
ncbi:phosphotransferase [Qipengyuania sp. SS22]|uniref:phosphotransferase n=1 Tax=Qipengyuania sp. SS22 TaxID=2979461 RepID=UPI0021E54E58|nr:phosphotransferase [Qipengyuania sp. SS22]UYH56080.1 phosphotransferase [Qipengyuania sp. SS22]